MSKRKPDGLYIRRGGVYKPATVADVINEIASDYNRESSQTAITGSATSKTFLSALWADSGLDPECEHFGLVWFNGRNQFIQVDWMFSGTIDGASVHPREVVKAALRCNAAAAIATHNHPSGNPEPSQSDRALTNRLREVLALVDVRLLDHIVMGNDAPVSFADRGWI